MTAADLVLALSMLVIILAAAAAFASFAMSAIGFLTTSDAHRDARRRNRAGDQW